MYFKDRQDAGRQLASLLKKYEGMEGVVYGLPRGGMVPAAEIAKALHFSLAPLFAHKIGHPHHPEYAIAAISEGGHLVMSSHELGEFEEKWFENEKERQVQEIQRKRKLYLNGKKEVSVQGKIAILVDDGVATGLTLQAGIQELKERNPKKIIVAVPVAPKQTAELLKTKVDDFISVETPDDYQFLGSVGAYYREFQQVEDEEVVALME